MNDLFNRKKYLFMTFYEILTLFSEFIYFNDFTAIIFFYLISNQAGAIKQKTVEVKSQILVLTKVRKPFITCFGRI